MILFYFINLLQRTSIEIFLILFGAARLAKRIIDTLHKIATSQRLSAKGIRMLACRNLRLENWPRSIPASAKPVTQINKWASYSAHKLLFSRDLRVLRA